MAPRDSRQMGRGFARLSLAMQRFGKALAKALASIDYIDRDRDVALAMERIGSFFTEGHKERISEGE